MTSSIDSQTFADRLTPLAQMESANNDWLKTHWLDKETLESTIKGFDENGIERVNQAALRLLDSSEIDLSSQAREILEDVTVICDELLAI